MTLIATYNIKKQRNEFGRQIRKDYEAGRMPNVRRKDIKEFVPMFDGICRTVTTIVEDNLLLEVYDTNDNSASRRQGQGLLEREGHCFHNTLKSDER